MNILEKYTDKKTHFLNIKKIKLTDILLELDYISFQVLNLLDSIFKYKEYPNFHNILGEFEKIKSNFETVNTIVAQLKTINNKDKALFPIIEDKARKIADYIDSKLYYNAEFLNILIGIKKHKLYDSAEELDILNDYISNLKCNGVFLTTKLKQRLTALYNQRDKLQEKYDTNLLNFEQNNYYIVMNEKLLDGIPLPVKNEFKKHAKLKRKKGFLIKNNYSNYSTIIDSAENPIMRKRATIEFNKTGHNNKRIIVKLLKIRQELANILGDKTYAQNVFNSGHTSISLPKLKKVLKTIIIKSRKKSQKDLKLLKDIAIKHKINKIDSYDIDFLLNKKNEEREKQKDTSKRIILLKDYYKLPTVFEGMKNFLKHSFGLSFIKTNFKSFDNKTLIYKVVKNRKLLGYIHFDIFSRSSKSNDAYALNLISRTNNHVGHVLISCGFKNNNVEFEDVSTLYHELGHAIHFLLSESEYSVKNSINIKQDFSELPSLLFEKFLKNDDFLKQWLRHHKTNKKLPKRIKSVYPNTKLEFEGFNIHKGAYLALLDIMVHELPINKKTDIKKFEFEFNKKYGIMPHTKEMTYNLYNFSHIFGNQPYDCLYYSYIYSNMLETQVYSKFKKAKYKNWDKVGKEFSKHFLQKGSKGKAFDHYIKFAKKMPDSTFLLKQYNIVK